jgi:hypothetical protein
MYVSFTRHKH